MKPTSETSERHGSMDGGDSAPAGWCLWATSRPEHAPASSVRCRGQPAVFSLRFHRHQPSRPPPAMIRPGRPAPAIGPGIDTVTLFYSAHANAIKSRCPE
jgi:hypothetical protein